MKKIGLLFALVFVFVSIAPFFVMAGEEEIGRIQIYADADACIMVDNAKAIEKGDTVYDKDGNPIGSVGTIGNTNKKIYILNNGTYMLINSVFITVKYVKLGADGNYGDAEKQVDYDSVNTETTSILISNQETKEVTLQPLTDMQKTVLQEMMDSQKEQSLKEGVPDMFSEQKLNPLVFSIIFEGIDVYFANRGLSQVICVVIFLLFFVTQYILCMKVKKWFVLKLLPLLFSCSSAVVAIAYLVDYYGKYNANDLEFAMSLIFWYDIVLSMYAGALLGLVAVIVYKMIRKAIHIIYNKRHLQNTDDKKNTQ